VALTFILSVKNRRRMGFARSLLGYASCAAFAFAVSCGGPLVATAPKKPSPVGGETRAIRLDAFAGAVIERSCASSGPELCFNARDDNCNGVIDEGCGVSTGVVQFAIAWDEETAQVDLLVSDPAGVSIETGVVADSGLMKERDCPEGCYGQNLENVFLAGDRPPMRGRYEVKVRLTEAGDAVPPVRVVLGARVGSRSYALEMDLEYVGDERWFAVEL
jgi:hypothetical protein